MGQYSHYLQLFLIVQIFPQTKDSNFYMAANTGPTDFAVAPPLQLISAPLPISGARLPSDLVHSLLPANDQNNNKC